MPSKRQSSKQRRAAQNRNSRAQREARAQRAGELSTSGSAPGAGVTAAAGGTGRYSGLVGRLFGGKRSTGSDSEGGPDPSDHSTEDQDDDVPEDETPLESPPDPEDSGPSGPVARPVSGRGVVATRPDGTRLPGALATFVAVVLAVLAVGMLMFTPTIEVDDRGEPVPGGATPDDQYKGLYLEARGYLLTGETGQPVDTESRTSVEQHGAGVALFFGLPVVMVVFAWWMHRRTGLSRPLTFGMLAVAVAVFLLQTSGQFYIPALIALAVGSFQARKAEMPARMAERAALQAEREARRKEREGRKSGDAVDDEDGAEVIDVESREKDD